MKKVKVTLVEAINLLQELDYVPGVSMAVPDFNYTVNKRKNFEPVDGGDPLDTFGNGPQNAQGYGQQGVGRGGVGWGGRPDSSGGVRAPSAAYTSTWDTTDESADYDEIQRHGRGRNVWRDTPEGEVMNQRVDDDEKIGQVGESMGTPFQTGPVAPMDGPSLQSFGRGYSSGSELDQLPSNQDMNNGPGNMWGGPGTIPGTSRSWAGSPTLGDDPDNVWKVPEKEGDMKLREFFDPSPVDAEPLTNPNQSYLNDGTDEEIEDDIQGMGGPGDEEHHDGEVLGPEGEEEPQSFAGRYGGETILMLPNMGRGSEFIMSPDKFGAARGTYGMHMDGKQKIPNDLLDKRSAWDVLQHVISAMANQKPAEPEIHQNIENTDQPG